MIKVPVNEAVGIISTRIISEYERMAECDLNDETHRLLGESGYDYDGALMRLVEYWDGELDYKSNEELVEMYYAWTGTHIEVV